MSYRQFNEAEIVAIHDESPQVKRFCFRFTGLSSFEFQSGQFVNILLPIGDRGLTRSYSIASAPGGNNLFELVISLNKAGQATPYMWANYKLGTKVSVAGPLGKFTLSNELLNADLCFVLYWYRHCSVQEYACLFVWK